MKTKIHRMRVISLLAIGAMLWVITPFTPAYAGYASGTRANGCDDFWLDGKPTFDGGKALSADLFEYNFSTKMRLGFDIAAEDNNCKARFCTAKVVGNWNSKTGQNQYQHLHSPPPPEKTRKMECTTRRAYVGSLAARASHAPPF